MKFNSVEEAFNYWNTKSIGEIEARSAELSDEVKTNPEADINSLNIEAEGLKQAKENLVEKRNNIMSFNPITRTQLEGDKEEMNQDIFATEEYRSAFFKTYLNQDLTDVEKRAIETANDIVYAEKRLDPFNTATDNANVIPTLTLNEIVRKATTEGGLLAEARRFNIPSKLKVPVADPMTTAEWHVEGAEVAGEKVIPTAVEFEPNELIKVFSMSAKARKMSVPAFESYITDELVRTVMEAINVALIDGTGEGQGKGIETIDFASHNNLIEYTGAITYDNLVATVGNLKRGYSRGAKWAMNNATLYSALYGMVDGNKRPIFIADPKGESIGRVLGFDVVIDDNIADGVVYFGNFNYLGYNIPDGVALEVSTQSSFNRGLIDYRALAIADTQVILPEAFVKLVATV